MKLLGDTQYNLEQPYEIVPKLQLLPLQSKLRNNLLADICSSQINISNPCVIYCNNNNMIVQ